MYWIEARLCDITLLVKKYRKNVVYKNNILIQRKYTLAFVSKDMECAGITWGKSILLLYLDIVCYFYYIKIYIIMGMKELSFDSMKMDRIVKLKENVDGEPYQTH